MLSTTKTELIDIADLDVIFLTYDEPRRDEFWLQLKNMVPWARRVDGVKGSDAAHKAAGMASTTERFILIDGDNVPDAAFFNCQLAVDSGDDSHRGVFRWKARNQINGLIYGNGGISSWTREFVANMRTHENSDGRSESQIEFCFEPNYWAMHDCYSTTYPNQTPFQAWRAGFREGVKMCLDRGRRPDLTEFEARVHHRNYDNLCVWHSVGADVENGFWAMLGARAGTYKTMLTDWDYREVQDFDALQLIWNDHSQAQAADLVELGDTLRRRLGLPIVDLSRSDSEFFKHHYQRNWRNRGVMQRDQ